MMRMMVRSTSWCCSAQCEIHVVDLTREGEFMVTAMTARERERVRERDVNLASIVLMS